MAKILGYILIFLTLVLFCIGCTSNKSQGLIPNQDYAQLFVEKKLNGNVEYKKIRDEKEINEVISLLTSVSVKTSGDLNTDGEGTYILSFWTKKDLDNREVNSTFYLALLQDGHIAYSGPDDHKMSVRYVSVKEKPDLVKKITEMIN
ncbi:hypothetical protein J5S49_09060 [Virgibacillus halodenitrificans]|uniref:hypothetical protein n=1 Tax=Virgibacillus halodenitrificans TaxID=1482 RepID=UPI00045CF7AD|nr:hypothetical protein [Virgibacillus halodenitrificans]MCG1028442.1 hypothetical protein [Virgibacillus halodenitrificans]CDQ32521.1 hypothetical protein BN993_01937 [Virgibacillus halodenitrificans]